MSALYFIVFPFAWIVILRFANAAFPGYEAPLIAMRVFFAFLLAIIWPITLAAAVVYYAVDYWEERS